MNCCEISLNDNIDVSVYFRAKIIFELEKLRFLQLFGEISSEEPKKKKKKKKNKKKKILDKDVQEETLS